jgi:hypothetical protein
VAGLDKELDLLFCLFGVFKWEGRHIVCCLLRMIQV